MEDKVFPLKQPQAPDKNGLKPVPLFTKGVVLCCFELLSCLRLSGCMMLTEMVELGVLVPYPEEGREANDQRRPSVLSNKKHKVIAQHRLMLKITR